MQSDAIRDFVFPVASVSRDASGVALKEFLGSAFVIGNRGFALTAAHVILGHESEDLVGLFIDSNGKWIGGTIVQCEAHPTEDVAVLRVEGDQWRSFFRLSSNVEHASCRYFLFGYPEDVALEVVVENRAILRPDLIFNAGYIRRRLTMPVLSLRGTGFFELSEIAGPGCSGSPVVKENRDGRTNQIWDVIGVYAGEKINDRGTSASYAVRSDTFRDWVPKCSGVSVLVESETATPF